MVITNPACLIYINCYERGNEMDYSNKKSFAEKRDQVTITHFTRDGRQVVEKLPLKDVTMTLTLNGEQLDGTIETLLNKLKAEIELEKTRVDTIVTTYDKKIKILTKAIEQVQTYLKERGKLL